MYPGAVVITAILAEAHEHGLDPADVYRAYTRNSRGYQLKWRFGAWMARERERQRKEVSRGQH